VPVSHALSLTMDIVAKVIICKSARLPGEDSRFLDPRSSTSFVFDHMRAVQRSRPTSMDVFWKLIELDIKVASDPQPFESDSRAEPVREALQEAVTSYGDEHYHNGATATFSIPNETTADEGEGESDASAGRLFEIYVVGNKYNPSNYWCVSFLRCCRVPQETDQETDLFEHQDGSLAIIIYVGPRRFAADPDGERPCQRALL
jgi:F-actin capping protein alpha subunit